jgi:tripartite-type tricarboxylate transporter receptor subunit TctC
MAIGFGLAIGVAAAMPASAQTLNYVIPFPAGGESDVTARIQEPVLRSTGSHLDSSSIHCPMRSCVFLSAAAAASPG